MCDPQHSPHMKHQGTASSRSANMSGKLQRYTEITRAAGEVAVGKGMRFVISFHFVEAGT